ncbi:hypothetical protein [Arthrobacter oryzae]|uniref:Uncharacterized protein n=1 Tax=Arthrobacter oryzae TaxID=409290 RepID=A0A495FN95_9MICC|nr:hypothetical protein [Arthrobacter oryzae]RKR29806.1 hypothetical protein C8D78_0121 [Arthrobacter oryzae]
MSQADDVIRHTRDDLIQALADELGSTPDDPRIHDAYEQVIDEIAFASFDPDEVYSRYFRDGPIATDLDLLAVRGWAKGRLLLD